MINLKCIGFGRLIKKLIEICGQNTVLILSTTTVNAGGNFDLNTTTTMTT